jgi:hypothetical protein
MPALLAQLLTVTLGMTLDSAPLLLSDQESYIKGLQPGGVGLDTFCRLFESEGSGGVKMRLYYGDGSFWLTYNAEWIQSASPARWYEDNSGMDAFAIGVAGNVTDAAFILSKKLKANFGSGWLLWDTSFSIGAKPLTAGSDRAFVPMIVSGKYLDICRWSISAGANAGGSLPLTAIDAVTYHSVLYDVPNYTILTVENLVGTWNAGILPTVVDADEYGAIISGTFVRTDSISSSAYGRLYIYDSV